MVDKSSSPFLWPTRRLRHQEVRPANTPTFENPVNADPR
jgi:hypothetical protein